jgi:hypothetical protein
MREWIMGFIQGWTWLEITPVAGVPAPSGRRFFTAAGANKDWRRYMDARGRAPFRESVVFLRRPFVEAWLDGWQTADGARGWRDDGAGRSPLRLREVRTWDAS